MKKTILDDGFQSYLTEGAVLTGDAGIPMLMDLHNAQVPIDLVPFDKARKEKNKRKYVHFYMHDKSFSQVLCFTSRYVDLLRQFDGVITPDPSLLINQSKCLQETNTYMNRAVGFYLQKNGIPVIPNVRWSDERSYEFCFLGIPKESIVAISTHGCIRSKQEKILFKAGLSKMLEILEPKDVIVHGYMPGSVFDEFNSVTRFHRYPSQFERTHAKEARNGNGV